MNYEIDRSLLALKKQKYWLNKGGRNIIIQVRTARSFSSLRHRGHNFVPPQKTGQKTLRFWLVLGLIKAQSSNWTGKKLVCRLS